MNEFMIKKLKQSEIIKAEKSRYDVEKSKKFVKGAKSKVRKGLKKSEDEAWDKAYNEKYEEVASDVREMLDSGDYDLAWGYNDSVDIELNFTYNGESYDRSDSLDIGDWGDPENILNLDRDLQYFNFDIDGLVSEVADIEATTYADNHWQEYDDSEDEDY